MVPPDWIEHRRADGEVVGWMVPDVADEFGAASAVGGALERFRLAFPAPRDLRPGS